MMFKPEVIKQKKGENRRSENSRNTRCYHKTSKKCQGKTITPLSIATSLVLQTTVNSDQPGTVKPVTNDHPLGPEKAVFIGRWSLVRGLHRTTIIERETVRAWRTGL